MTHEQVLEAVAEAYWLPVEAKPARSCRACMYWQPARVKELAGQPVRRPAHCKALAAMGLNPYPDLKRPHTCRLYTQDPSLT